MKKKITHQIIFFSPAYSWQFLIFLTEIIFCTKKICQYISPTIGNISQEVEKSIEKLTYFGKFEFRNCPNW